MAASATWSRHGRAITCTAIGRPALPSSLSRATRSTTSRVTFRAIASHAARFATPGVNIGLFCSTPMVALSRNVSRKHAMQMLLTGDLISAEEAARIGLVNEVVPAGEERAAALKLAAKIAGKSTLTVKIGKEAFYRQAEMPLADAYDYASQVMVENMLARDAEEGISAFIEKRDAKWQDR